MMRIASVLLIASCIASASRPGNTPLIQSERSAFSVFRPRGGSATTSPALLAYGSPVELVESMGSPVIMGQSYSGVTPVAQALVPSLIGTAPPVPPHYHGAVAAVQSGFFANAGAVGTTGMPGEFGGFAYPTPPPVPAVANLRAFGGYATPTSDPSRKRKWG